MTRAFFTSMGGADVHEITCRRPLFQAWLFDVGPRVSERLPLGRMAGSFGGLSRKVSDGEIVGGGRGGCVQPQQAECE